MIMIGKSIRRIWVNIVPNYREATILYSLSIFCLCLGTMKILTRMAMMMEGPIVNMKVPYSGILSKCNTEKDKEPVELNP